MPPNHGITTKDEVSSANFTNERELTPNFLTEFTKSTKSNSKPSPETANPVIATKERRGI
jgi:hypothetical protein